MNCQRPSTSDKENFKYCKTCKFWDVIKFYCTRTHWKDAKEVYSVSEQEWSSIKHWNSNSSTFIRTIITCAHRRLRQVHQLDLLSPKTSDIHNIITYCSILWFYKTEGSNTPQLSAEHLTLTFNNLLQQYKTLLTLFTQRTKSQNMSHGRDPPHQIASIFSTESADGNKDESTSLLHVTRCTTRNRWQHHLHMSCNVRKGPFVAAGQYCVHATQKLCCKSCRVLNSVWATVYCCQVCQVLGLTGLLRHSMIGTWTMDDKVRWSVCIILHLCL